MTGMTDNQDKKYIIATDKGNNDYTCTTIIEVIDDNYYIRDIIFEEPKDDK